MTILAYRFRVSSRQEDDFTLRVVLEPVQKQVFAPGKLALEFRKWIEPTVRNPSYPELGFDFGDEVELRSTER